MCVFIWLRCVNLFLQCLHSYGLSPVCVRVWAFSSIFVTNLLLQYEHLWFLIPRCRLMRSFNIVLLDNTLLHSSYEHLWDLCFCAAFFILSFLCFLRMCRFKCVNCVNFSLQPVSEHLNEHDTIDLRFRFDLILCFPRRCWFKWHNCVNFSLHPLTEQCVQYAITVYLWGWRIWNERGKQCKQWIVIFIEWIRQWIIGWIRIRWKK